MPLKTLQLLNPGFGFELSLDSTTVQVIAALAPTLEDLVLRDFAELPDLKPLSELKLRSLTISGIDRGFTDEHVQYFGKMPLETVELSSNMQTGAALRALMKCPIKELHV